MSADVEANSAHDLAAAEALLDAMDGEIVAVGRSRLRRLGPCARLRTRGGGAACAVRSRLRSRPRRCRRFAAWVPTFEQGDQIDHAGLEPMPAALG